MMILLTTASFQVPDIDFFQMIPILLLGFLVTAALCLELRDESEELSEQAEASTKPTVLGFSAVCLLGLVAYYVGLPTHSPSMTFNDMLYTDTISRVSGLLITICALLAILAGPDELDRYRNRRGGEFCALIFSASLGMVLMASAANTMVMFLGLELFSIALYLLCIFLPDRESSRESGMKYFLLSSAASAVLLYGLALLYGATGTTWLSEMRNISGQLNSGLLLTGTILVLCGLLFKLAIVPFHFWAPDVYEGAPTTVTAFMSVATKVAALAALWRFLAVMDLSSSRLCLLILFSLSLLSILVGNFLALSQSNVKRMLAYSGVANAGYLLMAPVSGTEMLKPMLFFLATYLVGNVGAFLALSQLESLHNGKTLQRKDLIGTFAQKPWLAAAFALCLVSLAGLPPAAGFMGKFFLFGRAIAAGQLILPVVGIAGSLIGAGYYLGTAITLFQSPSEDAVEPEESAGDVTAASQAALIICVVGILVLGVAPSSFLLWI